MKILALETSTMLGGIAIADSATGLIAEARMNVKSTHSERLMTMVDQVMEQSGLSIGDIDVIAVANGPGSFTGLRIGLSTAKGLSYATGKPLVVVPTLEAFAWHFPFTMSPVCIMLDARRGEVYSAVFLWENDGFREVIPAESIKPGDLLRKLHGTVIFAGEGITLYRDMIVDSMQERAIIASPEKMVPSPSQVAMLGLSIAVAGKYTEPSKAEPYYVRKSEAEVKWSERH